PAHRTDHRPHGRRNRRDRGVLVGAACERLAGCAAPGQSVTYIGRDMTYPPPYPPPYPQPYGYPYSGYPAQQPKTYVVWGIVTTLLGFMPLGVVSLVYAS